MIWTTKLKAILIMCLFALIGTVISTNFIYNNNQLELNETFDTTNFSNNNNINPTEKDYIIIGDNSNIKPSHPYKDMPDIEVNPLDILKEDMHKKYNFGNIFNITFEFFTLEQEGIIFESTYNQMYLRYSDFYQTTQLCYQAGMRDCFACVNYDFYNKNTTVNFLQNGTHLTLSIQNNSITKQCNFELLIYEIAEPRILEIQDFIGKIYMFNIQSNNITWFDDSDNIKPYPLPGYNFSNRTNVNLSNINNLLNTNTNNEESYVKTNLLNVNVINNITNISNNTIQQIPKDFMYIDGKVYELKETNISIKVN